jgi:hypothetical protein
MGLPLVTSAVLLIANFGKTWASRSNIWVASAAPSGIKREWYVCMHVKWFHRVVYMYIIIIISLLMFPLLSPRLPYGLHIRITDYNPPREPSAGWWVLTTANAARTNGLTCLLKHGTARDYKFLVTHPMNNFTRTDRGSIEFIVRIIKLI